MTIVIGRFYALEGRSRTMTSVMASAAGAARRVHRDVPRVLGPGPPDRAHLHQRDASRYLAGARRTMSVLPLVRRSRLIQARRRAPGRAAAVRRGRGAGRLRAVR